MASAPTPRRRLSRDEWLDRALEAVARKGHVNLKIPALVKELGVSRGSFYWHFADREDFIRSLAEHWARTSTNRAIEVVSGTDGDAARRLRALMAFITDFDAARYDIALRAWAAHEPVVAAVIERMDLDRTDFVRELFCELGFDGEELEMRTRVFAVFHSLEAGFNPRLPRTEQRRRLDRLHAFFTRR